MIHYREPDKTASLIFDSVVQKYIGKAEINQLEPEAGLHFLTHFESLKLNENVYVHHVTQVKSTTGSFVIFLIEKHLTIVESTRSGQRFEKEVEETEPVLVLELPQNIGRVLIRKETVGDKIADLFIRADIDFKEYPAFSKNYFVTADEPDLLRKYLPGKLLASLEKTDELLVEINGNLALVRAKKNLTESLLQQLFNIGLNLIH